MFNKSKIKKETKLWFRTLRKKYYVRRKTGRNFITLLFSNLLLLLMLIKKEEVNKAPLSMAFYSF